jgi:hypothetical protein
MIQLIAADLSAARQLAVAAATGTRTRMLPLAQQEVCVEDAINRDNSLKIVRIDEWKNLRVLPAPTSSRLHCCIPGTPRGWRILDRYVRNGEALLIMRIKSKGPTLPSRAFDFTDG